MNETLLNDEQTQAPAPPSLNHLVNQAKRMFRSVGGQDGERAPDAERGVGEPGAPSPATPRDAAAHDSWLKSLSDSQRRAYDAYREHGAALPSRDLRDLLRAAVSVHPDRDVAAEVIGNLRVPLSSDAARDIGERESGTFSRVLPTEPAERERAGDDPFRHASERLDRLVSAVRATRAAHAQTYRALGLPELPKDSPRRKQLELAVAPARDPSGKLRPRLLQPVDQRVRAIQKDIVDDPLWIAADYLDRTTSLDQVEDRVRADEGVQRAKVAYKQAEDRVRKAARELDAYAPPSRWQRTLDTVRGLSGEDARLRALHAEMKDASLALNHAKRQLDGVEREAREAAQELNAQALEVQREARERRDELEQPLRQALVDRYIAERALNGERALHHLREAPDLGSLTYRGERTIAGCTYHEFSNFGGATYFADAQALRSSVQQLELVPGDRVLLRSDEHGARHLQIDERAERAPQPLKGLQIAQALGRDRTDSDARGR